MSKKNKRRKLGPPGPEHFAARATGKFITVWRHEAIARVMDTAIWLWFLEKDPLSIHLLGSAVYKCLDDLGKKSGKGPKLKIGVAEEDFTTAYDFLRHASSNPNSGLDFAPIVNGMIIFDAVDAFNRVFSTMTIYMRTFRAYFILHPEPEVSNPDLRKRLLEQSDLFLPEAIALEEAMKLGRIDFFAKLTEMFAVQYRA